MSRVRALFMGTPEIARTCLEAMIKDPHFEVVGVVTQPDRPQGRKMQLLPSPVKALVVGTAIPVFTPEDVNSEESLKDLLALRAEVVVVVAFGQILKKKILRLFLNRIVNVHASLLPRWRGAAPMQRALMAGDSESGVSLQMMVRKLDAGPILGERRFALTPEMNANDVYKACEQLGTQLIAVDLMDYLRGHLTPQPQDESAVTYADKITKEEAVIDWQKSAVEIHNQVRGLALWPVASTTRNGQTLKVHRSRVVLMKSPAAQTRGAVWSPDQKSLLVQCGQGTLELLEVQPESRAKISAEEYLRGHPLSPGEILGGPK